MRIPEGQTALSAHRVGILCANKAVRVPGALPLLAGPTLLLALAFSGLCPAAAALEPRCETSLDAGWRTMAIETDAKAHEEFDQSGYDDSAWLSVDVPHSWNIQTLDCWALDEQSRTAGSLTA